MPRKYRLDDLRLRCQRRANKEGDPSISVPEWNMLISEQYGDLFSEVEKTGLRYFEKRVSIIADGSASYPVPDDHLATIGLDRVTDSVGSITSLDEMMGQERTRWAGQIGDANTYEIVGSSITFYPKPTTGTYTLLYLPQAPDLSVAADSTLVDLVQADGEAFLAYGVAVAALLKSEAEMQFHAAKQEQARLRFVDWCTMRAFTQPRRPIVRRSVNEAMATGDYIDDPGNFRDYPPR
jgi:hypothetical protein